MNILAKFAAVLIAALTLAFATQAMAMCLPVCFDGNGHPYVHKDDPLNPINVITVIIEKDPILSHLSAADKANLIKVIQTTGFISLATSGPGGMVILHILQGKEEKDVPVPTVDAPPTGKTWSFAMDCIVQQEKSLITAMTNNDPPHLPEVQPGDKLILTAPVCKEYKDKSKTSATIKYTGRSDYPDAKPPTFRHYLVGNAI